MRAGHIAVSSIMVVVVLAAGGCSEVEPTTTDGAVAGAHDAAAHPDAGEDLDGGAAVDAAVDAGSGGDAAFDAGPGGDASDDVGPGDAGTDAALPDAATDAGPDAGIDAGGTDAGTADAGTPKEDDAVVVATDLPSTLPCGGAYAAKVSMKNTGASTWSKAGGYKLGAVGDSDPLKAGDTRVWLPDGVTVPPGGVHQFEIPLVAPGAAGTYTTDWQMVREGIRWFGGIAKKDVQVQCAAGVDPSTMAKKLLMGYQGWFYCPGDGSPVDGWVHWFRSQTPAAQNATFDLWPDLSELDADELFATDMTSKAGGPARLYSAWNPKTVARHFKWMADAGIDGVLLQRFASELGDPRFLAVRDQVTRNVRAGAEAHGRVWAIEYDISGMSEATMVDVLKADWAHLVEDLKVLESPRYLRHKGRPVLFVWGFGFTDRPGTPAQAAELIAWLKAGAPAGLQVTLAGGVPTYWRTRTQDSKSDPAWAAVYRSYDVVNPWAVGRFADDKGADDFKKNLIAPDIAECDKSGIEYMPVVFPGFSWHNLFPANPVNQIPRRGGAFYWRQAYNAIGAGSTMIFNAMFDEVDEGTAMTKAAPTQADVPVEGAWLSLDADGQSLPADWYLRLAGEASRMLRGERALTPAIPITP